MVVVARRSLLWRDNGRTKNERSTVFDPFLYLAFASHIADNVAESERKNSSPETWPFSHGMRICFPDIAARAAFPHLL